MLRAFTLLSLILACLAVKPAAVSADEPTEAEKLFALKVQPLLREKCLACHGKDADKVESEFDLTSREKLLAGGESYGMRW